MRWLIAVLVVASSACRTAAPRLDALLGDLHARGLFDGAVVVGKGDSIVWAKGFGYANVERRIPFTPDTAADGASLAKTFTAALVLSLQNDGVVDLDAPVQRLLPELPYPEITLRHLLSHSSGIAVLDYDYFDRFLAPEQLRTTEVLLGVIASQRPPLLFRPGTGFEYSSFGYDLAALAAARAARKSYGALLNDRFFQPLGITSAFVRPGRLTDFPGVRTLGYRNGTLHDVFDLEAFHGGSNIYISARDLHRWNASFLRHNELSLARIGNAPSGLTLGSWYRAADGSAYWYSGHLQGFHSEVFRDPRSRWSIVYMSNNTIDPWLQKGLIRAIQAVLDGHEPRTFAPPATDAVSKNQIASIAGEWVLPDGRHLTIENETGRLSIIHNGVSYRLVHVGPSAFYVPGLDFMIGFGSSFSKIYVSSNVDEQWGWRAH